MICILSVIFTSCANSDLTVLVDSWWENAYDLDGHLDKALAKNSIEKISVGNVEEFSFAIKNISEKSSNPTVIITPVLFSQIKKIGSVEKKINYILLNGFYGDPADNVIAVYSSREEVYFQAGIKAALFSNNNDNCAVASIFYNGSSARRLEKDSFIDGFESIEDKGDLFIYEQQTYTGDERLKTFINSSPDKGVGLFFFSASSLNPFCLDLALPLSIPVSGENLNSLGIYNELVEFSVDDDMIEIIDTAIKIGLDGEIIDDFPIKTLIREKGIHF